MKKIVLLAILAPALAYGGQAAPDAYSRRESACIGAQDGKCIEELKNECKDMGGKWLGQTVGRGRQWGCERPTRDAGRRCADSSECESACVAVQAAAASEAPSMSTCHCAATTSSPKGIPYMLCTKDGIRIIQVD